MVWLSAEVVGLPWPGVLLTALVVGVCTALLCVWAIRSVTRPVSDMRAMVARLGEGDLEARTVVQEEGELGELCRELNGVASTLGGIIKRRTAERNQLADIFTYMHDGIILTDTAGRVGSINPSAARLFGVNPDGSVGRSLIELTHNYEIHQALQDALATPSGKQSLEVEVNKHNIGVAITVVPASDEEEVSVLIVLQDVTELRRLERVRRDFVANLGHELRTPLASVKLLVETLSASIYDDPDASEEFLRRINVELDGLTQLVRELLELSKIESGEVVLHLSPTHVENLLNRVAERLRAQSERAGLTFTVQAEPGLPLASIDAERIEQVLVNLLHNAIKFTPPSGSVALKVERQNDALCVSVSDTGVGIPQEELSRIFERFYKVDKARTVSRSNLEREGGTGLGLAIAKRIVLAHGGQIWAESHPRQGATFYFTLPVA